MTGQFKTPESFPADGLWLLSCPDEAFKTHNYPDRPLLAAGLVARRIGDAGRLETRFAQAA